LVVERHTALPCNDCASKMSAKESVLHLLFFSVFAATLYHNIANIFIDGVTNSYGGRFKFLTFINLNLSVFYYGFALLADLISSQRLPKKESNDPKFSLLAFRDFLFGSLAFPVAFLVTSIFWGVMCYDSELMLSSNLRHMIPVHGYYNHCAHSAPLLLAFLEMILIKHPHFPSKLRGIMFFTVFCVAYISWIMWIAYRANIWVYPFLKVLSWPGRVIFLGSAYIFGLCAFFIGFFINHKKSNKNASKLE